MLVAGFVAGGTEDVDANLETVRLLRSQLRTKSALRVIDADVLPLDRRRRRPTRRQAADAGRRRQPPPRRAADAGAAEIKDEKDLEPYEQLFANIGVLEEDRRGVPEAAHRHRHGAVHAAVSASGFVQREQEVVRLASAAAASCPVRTYMERKGFILRPKFIFIDGRTGATLYSETLPRRGPLQRAARTRRRCRPTSS